MFRLLSINALSSLKDPLHTGSPGPLPLLVSMKLPIPLSFLTLHESPLLIANNIMTLDPLRCLAIA